MTGGADPPGDWQDRAACAGSTGWDIDSGHSAKAQRARRICLDGCPVLAECRAWASRYRWTGVVIAGYSVAGGGLGYYLPKQAVVHP